jgi:hypothetical protein
VGILAGLFVGLIGVWITLRLVRPELAKEWSIILKGSAATIVGVLFLVLTLGLWKRKKVKPGGETIDPAADLKTTAAKYETEDTFEIMESGSDTLEPPPPSDILSNELESFRANADELLGDGDDPG